MKCIFGIGNPGNRYQNTRHNIGFILLDIFASKLKLNFKPAKSDFYFAEGEIESNPFIFVKPTTYVNKSGIAAQQCLSYNNIDVDNLLVLVDDINLIFPEIRLRKSGGDGGHNGLNSIIYHLGSENFPRLRFGIGTENFAEDLSDYVLSGFSQIELNTINKLSDFMFILSRSFILHGYDFMLSEYSRIKNLENKKNRTSDINE